MITNLKQYFLDEYQYALESIYYNLNQEKPGQETGERELRCIDNIQVKKYYETGLYVTHTRKLQFVPAGAFDLSVSFSAIVRFDETKKGEVDWENEDLAKAFKKDGKFLLDNLVSRSALLIAEITASYGQFPLITMPHIPAGGRDIQESDNEKTDQER